MIADYGDSFLSQFRAESGLTKDRWQWRLHHLTQGVSDQALVEGFDSACRASPKRPPSPRAIQEAVILRQMELDTREAVRAEAEQLAQLPKPKAGEIDEAGRQRIFDTWRQACDEAAKRTEPERRVRLTALLEQHEALLTRDGVMTRLRPLASNQCEIPGCYMAGTFSPSGAGKGPWYCRFHFRQRRDFTEGGRAARPGWQPGQA